MQTAKVTVNLSPETSQVKNDITPAEALILRKMFFKSSQGSPLTDIEINGTATENGKPRSNTQEVTRLKAKYTGVIDGKRAFEAVFGTASIIHLPQTFAEVREDLGGIEFAEVEPTAAESDANAATHEWLPEHETELQDLLTTPRKNAAQKQRLDDLQKYKASASNV